MTESRGLEIHLQQLERVRAPTKAMWLVVFSKTAMTPPSKLLNIENLISRSLELFLSSSPKMIKHLNG